VHFAQALSHVDLQRDDVGLAALTCVSENVTNASDNTTKYFMVVVLTTSVSSLNTNDKRLRYVVAANCLWIMVLLVNSKFVDATKPLF
jgi:hypothetical protein